MTLDQPAWEQQLPRNRDNMEKNNFPSFSNVRPTHSSIEGETSGYPFVVVDPFTPAQTSFDVATQSLEGFAPANLWSPEFQFAFELEDQTNLNSTFTFNDSEIFDNWDELNPDCDDINKILEIGLNNRDSVSVIQPPSPIQQRYTDTVSWEPSLIPGASSIFKDVKFDIPVEPREISKPLRIPRPARKSVLLRDENMRYNIIPCNTFWKHTNYKLSEEDRQWNENFENLETVESVGPRIYPEHWLRNCLFTAVRDMFDTKDSFFQNFKFTKKQLSILHNLILAGQDNVDGYSRQCRILSLNRLHPIFVTDTLVTGLIIHQHPTHAHAQYMTVACNELWNGLPLKCGDSCRGHGLIKTEGKKNHNIIDIPDDETINKNLAKLGITEENISSFCQYCAVNSHITADCKNKLKKCTRCKSLEHGVLSCPQSIKNVNKSNKKRGALKQQSTNQNQPETQSPAFEIPPPSAESVDGTIETESKSAGEEPNKVTPENEGPKEAVTAQDGEAKEFQWKKPTQAEPSSTPPEIKKEFPTISETKVRPNKKQTVKENTAPPKKPTPVSPNTGLTKKEPADPPAKTHNKKTRKQDRKAGKGKQKESVVIPHTPHNNNTLQVENVAAVRQPAPPKEPTAMDKALIRQKDFEAQVIEDRITRRETQAGVVSYNHNSRIESHVVNTDKFEKFTKVQRFPDNYSVTTHTFSENIWLPRETAFQPAATQPCPSDIPLIHYVTYTSLRVWYDYKGTKLGTTESELITIPASLLMMPRAANSTEAEVITDNTMRKYFCSGTLGTNSNSANCSFALLPRFHVEEAVDVKFVQSHDLIKIQHDENGFFSPPPSNWLSKMFLIFAFILLPFVFPGLRDIIFMILAFLLRVEVSTLFYFAEMLLTSNPLYFFMFVSLLTVSYLTRWKLNPIIQKENGMWREETRPTRLARVAWGKSKSYWSSLSGFFSEDFRKFIVRIFSYIWIALYPVRLLINIIVNITKFSYAFAEFLFAILKPVVKLIGECLKWIGKKIHYALERVSVTTSAIVGWDIEMEEVPDGLFRVVSVFSFNLDTLLQLSIWILYTYSAMSGGLVPSLALLFMFVHAVLPIKGFRTFDSVILAPILEETTKQVFPFFSIVLGLVEARPKSVKNVVVRTLMHHTISTLFPSLPLAMLFHAVINFSIITSYRLRSMRLNRFIFKVVSVLTILTVLHPFIPQVENALGCLILYFALFCANKAFPELELFRITDYLYGYGKLSQNNMIKKRARGLGVKVSMNAKHITQKNVTYRQIAEGGLDERSFKIVPPHPTTNSPTSLLEGYVGRLCSEAPVVDPEEMKNLVKWVETKFLDRVRAINESELISMTDYLNNVSNSKKKRYAKEFKNFCTSNPAEQALLVEKMSVNGAFIKPEFYEKISDPRAIYTPKDLAKCFYGWMFSQIEKQIYEFPEAVKHIPVGKRAAYIKSRLRKFKKFLETDFTSLEGSISAEWLEKVEFLVYRKVFQNCSKETRELVDNMLKMLSSCVVTKTRNFTTVREAGRHSGGMNTALGNLITNMILIAYLFEKEGIPFIAVFEGDDGLINADHIPDLTVVRKLGFKITFDVADTIGGLSFCGMKFSNSGQTMSNPFMIISKITFVPKQYMAAKSDTVDKLITMKCVNALFEHPNCPMVSAYCSKIIEEMRGKFSKNTMIKFVNAMHVDDYQRKRYLDSLSYFRFGNNTPINDDTRYLFYETYGVCPTTQILFESAPTSELSRFIFTQFCPVEWIYNSEKYLSKIPRDGMISETIYQGVYRKTEDLTKIEYIGDLDYDRETLKKQKKDLKIYKRSTAKLVRSVLDHPLTGPSFINQTTLQRIIDA